MSDSERQAVLFAPTRPTSIREPHEEPLTPGPDSLHPHIEDLDSDDLFVPASTAANFLCIDPSWNALQLRTAYSHLLRANKDGEQEHPELLLHNVAQPRLLDFVQAIEIGFKYAESRAGGESLADAIEGAGCSRWLSEGDIERAINWAVSRGREMDLDIGYEVPEGYRGSYSISINSCNVNRLAPPRPLSRSEDDIEQALLGVPFVRKAVNPTTTTMTSIGFIMTSPLSTWT